MLMVPMCSSLSQAPGKGCHGTSFRWGAEGESDVHHFCAGTLKNTREVPRSLPSPAVLMAEVCVGTMDPSIWKHYMERATLESPPLSPADIRGRKEASVG